jgi:hypothetical protein
MNILTKQVAEMTIEEALMAAKIGRLYFDPEENSFEAIEQYNTLPSKKILLKSLQTDENNS